MYFLSCRYNSDLWADTATLLATINDESAWNQTLTGPGFTLEQVRLATLPSSEPSLQFVLGFLLTFCSVAHTNAS